MLKALLCAVLMVVVAALFCWLVLTPPYNKKTITQDHIGQDSRNAESIGEASVTENDLDARLPPQPAHQPATQVAGAKVVIAEIAAVAEHLSSSNTSVREDLEILDTLLNYYRRVYVQNPVAGVNEEVVEALTGKNARNLALISPDHPAINPDGKLVDKWGMPYFFHALSGEHMEISSAGPDRKFGTHDDVKLE